MGGALAVSWSMVQRMLNALIAFGPDVVRLYVEAYSFASRVAGRLALRSFRPDRDAHRRRVDESASRRQPWACASLGRPRGFRSAARAAGGAPGVAAAAPIVAEGSWSLARFGLVSAGLLAGMAGLSVVPLWLGALYVAAFAAIVLRTYPRASARIRRPALWIELAAVMLLAGLLLGGVRHGAAGVVEGLHAGSAMVLRAVLVLFGFTAVSVELRNPLDPDAASNAGGCGACRTRSASPSARCRRSPRRSRRPGATWRRPVRLAAELVALAGAMANAPRETGRRARLFILTGATGLGQDDARERGRRAAAGPRASASAASSRPACSQTGGGPGSISSTWRPESRRSWRARTRAAQRRTRSGAGSRSLRKASRSGSRRSAPMRPAPT